MTDAEIRIPLRVIRVGLPLLVLAAVVLVPASRDFVINSLATAWNPPATADEAALVTQREATERAIGRGYAKATDQLRRVRELRLPVSEAEANRIHARAIDELRAARRSAVVAIAEAYAMRGQEADEYVRRTDERLESASLDADAAVLLAPRLHGIVARANELLGQIADRATRELTAPRGTPTPTPTPSPTPRR